MPARPALHGRAAPSQDTSKCYTAGAKETSGPLPVVRYQLEELHNPMRSAATSTGLPPTFGPIIAKLRLESTILYELFMRDCATEPTLGRAPRIEGMLARRRPLGGDGRSE